MKKLNVLAIIVMVVILLPTTTFGSTISTKDYSLELPGKWKSDIEDDGVSATIEKENGGFYKVFVLNLSEKTGDNEILDSKKQFSQHFNAIENKDQNIQLFAGDLHFESKKGIAYKYFILYASANNELSFYALTSIRHRVMLISYHIYQVDQDMRHWEDEFKSILDSLQ